MAQILVILDGQNVFNEVYYPLLAEAKALRIQPCDFEDAYEWVVKEAFSRHMQGQVNAHLMSGHYGFDVYKCLFDAIGFQAQCAIKRLVDAYQLYFFKHQKVKMMVTYKEIIIVKTSPNPFELST
jgi:hypothetical protein